MDALDRKILLELQREARLSVTELADRVRLSTSAAHRRLRDLERTGVLTGYRAQVDAQAVGFGFEALVFITMSESSHDIITTFERTVVELPQIVSAQRLFGTPDFLLRVVAQDLDAFRDLYDQSLSHLPGVQKITSTLVMHTIIDNRPFPL